MFLKTVRRTIIALIGGTILLIGLAMVILPGPAVIVVPLGLFILTSEFVWARLWVKRAKKHIKSVQKGAGQIIKKL